jgi:hypothetical protein
MVFDTSVFLQPAQYAFGNAGRNIMLAPGFTNVDMSPQRTASFAKGTASSSAGKCSTFSTGRNFDIPRRAAFSANFGRIFNTGEPARQMQSGLKLVF